MTVKPENRKRIDLDAFNADWPTGEADLATEIAYAEALAGIFWPRRRFEHSRRAELVDDETPPPPPPDITPTDIIEAVAAETGVGVPEIMSEERRQSACAARRLVWHLAKVRWPSIGLDENAKILGRGHTSCLRGLRTITEQLQSDMALRSTVSKLKARLIR